MLIALPHKIKTIATAILSASGLLLGFVWTYLEKVLPISSKQELPTIYLVQIISSGIIIIVALLALVVLLAWHLWERPKTISPVDLSKYKNPDIKETESKPRNDFIHHNDMLWLHNDPVPFCLPCHEKDKKEFHMFVKIPGNPPRYKCQHCGYYPKASKHPDDPEDPAPSKPKQPLFITRSGWVTKWKDQ